MTEDRFAVQLPGLDLKNPFMPSSGSFYYGLDHMKDFDLIKMGALVLKTTTVDERATLDYQYTSRHHEFSWLG